MSGASAVAVASSCIVYPAEVKRVLRGGSPHWISPTTARFGGLSLSRDRFDRVPSWFRDPAAPEPNVPRKIGVTALIERDDLYLVERRVDDPDVWAFIGGTLEDGERLVTALQREVREETGFEVETVQLLGVFSDPTRVVAYPDGTVCRVLSIAFRTTVAGHHVPQISAESAGMRFVARDELAILPFWPAQLPIRDALLADPAEPIVA